MRFFTERLASPPVDTTVACVAGEVVGFTHWEGDGIAQVFVLPAWHGHGVAPLLLAAGEAALRAAGHRRVWLQCRVGNMRARAFYEKHGWVVTGEVGTTLGHVEGRSPVMVWRMAKSLT